MSEETTMRPKQWLLDDQFAHMRIVDCDGWTYEEWQRQDPLTREEFSARLMRCTLERVRPPNGGLKGAS